MKTPMGGRRRDPLLFFLLLLLLTLPPQASGLRLGPWRTLLSLSHSLLSRAANARAARGDLAGASRARSIADHLRLLDGGLWSLGWDFLRNYAWRGGLPSVDVYRSASRLLAALSDAARVKSREEMARWLLRNYPDLLSLCNSLLQDLLRVFSRSGPLREAVLVLKREVEEGELLRDCLEVGAQDLEGLLRIAKDLLFSYSSTNSGHEEL